MDKIKTYKKNILFAALLHFAICAYAQQPFEANYDETNVGNFTLPDPMMRPDGSKVANKKEWEKQRMYWLSLYQQFMFGKMPTQKVNQSSKLLSRTIIMNGKAVQYVWRLSFERKHDVTVLGVLPNVKKKVPVFLGLNFCGNQSTSANPDIPIFEKYVICDASPAFKNQHSQPESRGSWKHRWQYEKIIEAGFGSITVACGDFEEDKPDGYKVGIRSTLANELGVQPEEWSAIGAWAWGLSRIVDFLEKQPAIDSRKVILHGHSRLGKAALWAGAYDQ